MQASNLSNYLTSNICCSAKCISWRSIKSSRRSSTLALPTHTFDDPSPPQTSFKPARQRSLDELQETLLAEASPSRVWAHYNSLLTLVGNDPLPLRLHQDVLRRCTIRSSELRVSAARRLLAMNKPSNPHLYEGRFQTIVRNIRFTGMEPTIEDYHFILGQFAAAGHHVGVMQVYQELVHIGLIPTSRTYTLCLQSLAHRLSLPIKKANQLRIVIQTRKMLADLMNDMAKYDIPFSTANLDLIMRILKETIDREVFESLMKTIYGIDLSYPDRLPLELQNPSSMAPIPMSPKLHSFSTSALNTTIDILGRLGDISKLVQAFEVLTQPIPQAEKHFFTSFDDDEDFGPSVGPIFPKSHSLPHAKPNTATYNIILRHICRAGHAILARHYLLQAISLENELSAKLHDGILRYRHKVPPPNFAINRGTLLSIFGYSNRDKNLGLMRWLSTKIPAILRGKKKSLAFCSSIRDSEFIRHQSGNQFSDDVNPCVDLGKAPLNAPQHVEKHAFSPSTTAFKPSSALRRHIQYTNAIFDSDLDDSSVSTTPTIKIFDINLHIRVLERDIFEIEHFSRHLNDVLGRTHQRTKERLGRRVWSNKDIFLSSSAKRVYVTRDKWREIVNFKSRPSALCIDTERRNRLISRREPPQLDLGQVSLRKQL